MNDRNLKLISGNSNVELAERISMKLDVPISDSLITTFSDGETRVEIHDNMRGKDVFVIQSTSHPVNDNLMELFLILDALKRSNCWRVTAVIPYFGYARQDKKLIPRVPISAKAVADMIQVVGVQRVLTMDLHANQIQGYFDCPVDNLFASSIFMDHLRMNTDDNTVLVSPDKSGFERVSYYAKLLNLEAAIIHKSRLKPNEVEEMTLIGSVYGKKAVIIDDIIDTAGTLCKAAETLRLAGAEEIKAYATHGVFSGNALSNIDNSFFDEIVVLDTILQTKYNKALRVLSSSDIFAKAIENIHNETSVSCLFDLER